MMIRTISLLIKLDNLCLVNGVKKFNTTFQQSNFHSSMSKPKVYVTRSINEQAIDLLREHCDVSVWSGSEPVSHEELKKQIVDKDGLFCFLTDKIDSDILDHAKNLKVISTMSVGYDHLDLTAIRDMNIKVGYTPGVLTDATAELTLALLLATSRRLIEANESAKTGKWNAWAPFYMCGPSLVNSTVGIVGFGSIGQAVAKRVLPFGVSKIIYYNRSERFQTGMFQVDFQTLLKESDFVIICIASTDRTRGMFNEEAFNAMKPSAVLINTARGDIVDQDALVTALRDKRIWAAGLDVMSPEPLPTDHPLFKLDNTVILPHIGSAAFDTRMKMAELTAQNIIAGLKNQSMPSPLKF